MDQPSCESVIRKLGQVADLYHRLVIVVAKNGSGKTALLRQVHERIHAPIINVSAELSKRLLDLTERQRALQVPRVLAEVVEAPKADVVLLDNIEVLFDVSLKQDPLRLLQSLSRNRTLVVAWNGAIENDQLKYAAPDHPEFRKYAISDLQLVSPEAAT